MDNVGTKLLIGDQHQLAAIGVGGGMDLLAQSGARYELADARRFDAERERAASPRLRAEYAAFQREYHQHGRLLVSGTTEQAQASAAAASLGCAPRHSQVPHPDACGVPELRARR